MTYFAQKSKFPRFPSKPCVMDGGPTPMILTRSYLITYTNMTIVLRSRDLFTSRVT